MDKLFAESVKGGTSMRKVLATIVLLIVLLTSVNALASSSFEYSKIDSFEIRNGIKFGITKEEVISKELLETEPTNMYGVGGLKIRGSISGVIGAEGYYCFDENGLLSSLLYDFDLTLSISSSKSVAEMEANSEYNRIEAILSEKYGNELKNSCYVNSSSFLWDINNAIKKTSSDFGAINWSQRLLKLSSGGYVKIEHYMLYDYRKAERKFEHKVIYSYFTDNQVDAIIESVYGTSEDVGGSTANDL
jgi:hypothetical protein